MTDASVCLNLPGTLTVAAIDVSPFNAAIQFLLNKISALEKNQSDLRDENYRLSSKIGDLNQQAVVSQDQYASLYDTVHEGLSKLAKLQANAYEKTQAVQDLGVLHRELDMVKVEMERIDRAKIDANSQELETRVQQTASDSTSRVLLKFEKDQKEWTTGQMSVLEERVSKHNSAKLSEVEAALEQKLAATQHQVEDISHREFNARKELDTQVGLLSNLIRLTATKAEMHEKQLDAVEDDILSRIDLVKTKLDVFLENCIGMSWDDVMSSISLGSDGVSLELRRALTEPVAEDNFRRGSARIRRQTDNLREWRRLNTLSTRVLVGVGDVLKRLEMNDDQYEANMMAKLSQRRIDEVAADEARKATSRSHLELLRHYVASQLAAPQSTSQQAPPAMEALRKTMESPLFSHIRGGLNREMTQSLMLAREQFGQEYSDQLALVNKELRLKATMAGLEEMVREYTNRSMKTQIESIERRVEGINSTYVTSSSITELLSTKADSTTVSRKADAIAVQMLETTLREDIQNMLKRTTAEFHAMTMSRLTEISKDMVSRRDPKVVALLDMSDNLQSLVTEENNPKACIIAQSAKSAPRCINCLRQPSGGERGDGSENASQREDELQNIQDEIHRRQQSSGASIRKSLTSAPLEQQQEDQAKKLLLISTLQGTPAAASQEAAQPFRMKDWVEGVDKKVAEKRAPRPPTAGKERR